MRLALNDPTFRAKLQKNVVLRPTVYYPFPSGASLVRGSVVDADNKAVRGAVVKGRSTNPDYHDPNTHLQMPEIVTFVTGEDGAFVLPFQRVTARAAGQTVDVSTANHPTQNLTLLRGATTSAYFKP